MNTLNAPFEDFTKLGTISLTRRVGIGEMTLGTEIAIEPGSYDVYYVDEDVLDELAEESGDDALFPQLLLVHSDLAATDLSGAGRGEQVAETALEAARFTIADLALRPMLDAPGGFSEHLDGKHGVLVGGQGVTVMLSGDGSASVRAEPRSSRPSTGKATGPRWLVIDLR